MPLSPDTALVLFSGGQDSTVCLAWALARFARVETVGFDYGQRHAVELDLRPKLRAGIAALDPGWAARLGDDHVLHIDAFADIGGTALTSDMAIEIAGNGLPTTFVPGRNLVFLSFAGALAYRRGAAHLVAGMCETDYSGYPDCRDATLRALEQAIRLGTEIPFTIETPLMWRTKAETWALAQELGGDDLVDLILEETHTCYKGERGIRHDWGYGCRRCPACDLRAKGFAEWQAYRAEVGRQRQRG